MTLKILQHFDNSFTLTPEAKEALFNLVQSEAFLKQIAEHFQCAKVEFIEYIFNFLQHRNA